MKMPELVAQFLSGKRFAVAGVSRHKEQAANAVFRKLRNSGYEVFPVNPKAAEAEGVACYPDLRSIPGVLDGVVIVTHPSISAELVRQCHECGVNRVWLHRSFGQGSVSDDAIEQAKAQDVKCIVGGCPLMYCAPIDSAHKCMRWWLRLNHRVPG